MIALVGVTFRTSSWTILQHRRSYYGYFCRRSMAAFKKLSFAGTTRLREDHSAWLQGHNEAGYHKVEVDPMSIGSYAVGILRGIDTHV